MKDRYCSSSFFIWISRFSSTLVCQTKRLIGVCLAPMVLLSCDEKHQTALPNAVSTPVAVRPSAPVVENPSEAFRAALSEDRLEDARSLLDKVSDEDYRRFLTDQLNAAMEQRVRRRARENPVGTLDWIIQGGGGVETFWLEVAMAEYLAADRDAALAWHGEHAAGLSAEQNDRILLALARWYLAAGDWKPAAAARDKMHGEELKTVIGGEVGSAMEKDIRARVRQSPTEAMALLLDGNSGFETFWIEVAFNEFMAMDGKQANDWYASHGRSVPLEQHDRLALAYTRWANQSGDKETALGWAERINEKRLRQVVLEEISR